MTIAEHTPSLLLERARARIVLSHLRLLKAFVGEKPVPLGYWMMLRSLLGAFTAGEDPLTPPHKRMISQGASLGIPELRPLLAGDTLGKWSLDASVIRFIWRRLLQDRPHILIECGAGLSSIVLAAYARLAARQFERKPVVLSLEQDLNVVRDVRERLRQHGLNDLIVVLHAPISERGRYGLDADRLANHVGPGKADLVLIDGPAGPPGCREWTLSLLAPLCRSGARWFLDDSFRDGEINVLRSWRSWPGITVEGILPIGKGLGTGTVDHAMVSQLPPGTSISRGTGS